MGLGVCPERAQAVPRVAHGRSGRLSFASIFAFSTFPNTLSTQVPAAQAVVSLVRYVEIFFAMLNPCFLAENTLTGKNGAKGCPLVAPTLANAEKVIPGITYRFIAMDRWTRLSTFLDTGRQFGRLSTFLDNRWNQGQRSEPRPTIGTKANDRIQGQRSDPRPTIGSKANDRIQWNQGEPMARPSGPKAPKEANQNQWNHQNTKAPKHQKPKKPMSDNVYYVNLRIFWHS